MGNIGPIRKVKHYPQEEPAREKPIVVEPVKVPVEV